MLIRACIAKIHRATVTEADLNYVGSITIDQALLELSGISRKATRSSSWRRAGSSRRK